ncbi:hypothetical protein S83_059990 [Arachis hypogaea]
MTGPVLATLVFTLHKLISPLFCWNHRSYNKQPIEQLASHRSPPLLHPAATAFCSDGFEGCVLVIAELAFSVFTGVASSVVAVAHLPPRRRFNFLNMRLSISESKLSLCSILFS